MVDVKYVRMMKRYIPLSELKQYHLEHKASGGPLKGLSLFTRARLSVQPLTQGKHIKQYSWLFYSNAQIPKQIIIGHLIKIDYSLETFCYF